MVKQGYRIGKQLGRLVVVGLLLLLVCVPPASAQSVMGYNILNGRKVAEIPFQQVNNLIIIPVLLDNTMPLQFILDTGVRTTILTDRIYSDILNINYDRKYTLQGAGAIQQVDAYVASNVDLVLPNVIGYNQAMLVLARDYLDLKSQLGIEVHGILGYEFFNRFVVKINYQENQITLYEPEKFRKPAFYQEFDINIRDTKPYLTCQVTDREDGYVHHLRLMLDTGASHAMLLHQTANNPIRMPEETIDTHLGRGLAGDIKGKVGRVLSLEIGDFFFEDVLTSFPESGHYGEHEDWFEVREGTLGGDIFSRFTVIFDYPNQKIYLRRNRRYKNPFIYSRTGMSLTAKGKELHTFVVEEVREGSPAYVAGVRANDTLLKLNGKGAAFLTLSEITDFLRRRNGKKIKLKMLRAGEEYKTEFRLQDII